MIGSRLMGLLCICTWVACALAGSMDSGLLVLRPAARAQSQPMPHSGDSADDPAIWVHPTRPELSLILGTDKQGGLHVYEPDGSTRQVVSDGSQPNNVDVLYDFDLNGRRVDLAVATVRGRRATGVKVWLVDPDARMLRDITAGPVISVLNRGMPYGLCTYRSRKTGQGFFFVNDYQGRVEQHALTAGADGKISSRKVRSFAVSSITEGCVADDEQGWFYLAEETVGIWKFPAEPDLPAQGRLLARVGEHGLRADIEGLTLYCATGGRGYLIAASQSRGTFHVYRREGDNEFVGIIDPVGGLIDDVSDTDGIAASSCPIPPLFPRGVFIAQDGANSGGNQNFKFYGWEDVAGSTLLIDTGWSPRSR